MPMTWTPQADAKLFAAVVKVYEIKLGGGEKLQQIARLMGSDCTAKAITHRIAKIKSEAASLSPSASVAPPRPRVGTTKTSPLKPTAKSANGGAKSGKGTTTPDDDDDDDDDAENEKATKAPVTPPD
ncbi:hypothetical protein LTR28_012838, partial [Elasticomyces elasticus]